MTFSRKFNYSAVSQRKVVDYNNFLTFVLLGGLFAEFSFLVTRYLFYFPGIQYLVLIGLAGLFAGNMGGRFVYPRREKYKNIYLTVELSFLLLCVACLLRNLALPSGNEALLWLFFRCKYSIPMILFVILFFFGMKMNYSIRVSCGDFIDKTQGIERFVGFVFLGAALGMVITGILRSFELPSEYLVILPLLVVPSTCMINLPYDAPSLYTREDEEDRDPAGERESMSGPAFFTYLNFLSVVVYSFLGCAAIERYFGNMIYVILLFLVALFLFILLGYGLGRLMPWKGFHSYGQAILPAVFLLFLALLFGLEKKVGMIPGIVFFAPVAITMGILMYHTVRMVVHSYDSIRRSTIVEFSFIMVPVPVGVALSFVTFTNAIYIVVAGIVMATNLIVPAIYITGKGISGYKKILYYVAAFFFLPLYLLVIIYHKMPFNNEVFVTMTGRFDDLLNVNYNAKFIKARSTVTMKGKPVFRISDSVIRNYKRALVPIALYHPENEKILFIDGNQRFFRNPVIGYYGRSSCLDPLSDRDVDFRKLPFSGTQSYVPDNGPVLLYLGKNRARFRTIVDLPNLLDQRDNSFRFSPEYFRIIKNRLEEGGLFVQVYSIPGCRPEIFHAARAALQSTFGHHAVYFFSDQMVVLSTDGENTLTIDSDAFDRLVRFMESRAELAELFYGEMQVLSHLAWQGLGDLPRTLAGRNYVPGLYFQEPGPLDPGGEAIDRYFVENDNASHFFNQGHEKQAFNRMVMDGLRAQNTILTLLKKSGIAEARDDFIGETALLFELKKQAEFRIDLQRYVLGMLEYKEKYFYGTALRLEKERKWEEAQGLYRAVLAINPDNFNANYRMGLVALTLQDIEGSFNYLQQAMRIRSDDPNALYQMGVLHYSTGRFQEGIKYFTQALEKDEKMPGIYRYLGLCNDRLGNLYDAERFYTRALVADPNDVDTKARLDEVRSLIEKEKKKWETPEQKNEFEVEQNAEMPLPVSRGAYEMRLRDDDTSLPVADPAVPGGEGENEGP